MRIFKIAVVMFLLAAGLALAVTFPAARAGAAGAVAVRQGKALVVGASGNVLRTLDSGGAVGRAAMSPDGERVAMSVGTPVAGGPDGVTGQIVVADTRTGLSLARTRFEDAHIGGVSAGPAGRIAFVKDWYELWLLESSSGALRKIADGRSFGPPVSGAGGLLFDPAFAPDGASIVVGRVEQTFDGEDDALDNLWRVRLDGAASPLTSLERPAGGWRIARAPVVLDARTVLFTTTSSASDWEVSASTDGAVRSLGRVAADSYFAGIRDGYVFLLAMNSATGRFDLLRSGDGGTTTLLRGLTWFDLPDAPPADTARSGTASARETTLERLTARLADAASLGR